MLRYEIIVCLSNEDQAFIAEVPELPGCMAHGDDRETPTVPPGLPPSSDGSLWRIRVVPHEQGGIRWRSWDKLATPQRWGRWRTHSLGETFRWYIDGKGVLVISGDVIGEYRYTIGDFWPSPAPSTTDTKCAYMCVLR